MLMTLALLLVQMLLLAFFLPACVLKIVGHAHMRHEFSRFRLPYAWARWAGAVELLACVLLLAGFRQALLLAVGGLLLVPVMIGATRSEEHTYELQSLMRISYAVFCLKKKTLQI